MMDLNDYVISPDIDVKNIKPNDRIQYRNRWISKIIRVTLLTLSEYVAPVYGITFDDADTFYFYENGKSVHEGNDFDIVKIFQHKTNIISDITFPSDNKVSQVEVWVDIPTDDCDDWGYGIIAAHGRIGDLESIEKQIQEEHYDMFTKSGIYLLNVQYCTAQIGEYGRIEVPSYYDLSLVAYREHSHRQFSQMVL